jgi:hypothetical protein
MRQLEVMPERKEAASFFVSVRDLFRQLFCCRGGSGMMRTQSSEKLVDSSLGLGETSEATEEREQLSRVFQKRNSVAENTQVKTMTGGTGTGLTWRPRDPLTTRQDDEGHLTVTAEIHPDGQNIPTDHVIGPNLISIKEQFNEVFGDDQDPGDTIEEKFRMVFDPKNSDDSNNSD